MEKMRIIASSNYIVNDKYDTIKTELVITKIYYLNDSVCHFLLEYFNDNQKIDSYTLSMKDIEELYKWCKK